MAGRRRVLSDAVLLEVVALPVVLAHLPHPPCALQGAREAERVLPGLEVLHPKGHPEKVDVPQGLVVVQHVEVGLPSSYGNLRVPGASHGPLVDVGRTDNDVGVVNNHHLGVNINRRS